MRNGSKNGSGPAPSLAAPAVDLPAPAAGAAAASFSLAALRAMRHALGGCIPNEHYAGWREAARTVERLIEEVERG
jgi:hypothetical protein